MSPLSVVSRRAGADQRSGGGTAFGTFGELLQGNLPDGGTDFLVTFPIDRHSYARFRLEPGRPLQVYPSHKWKSLRLAQILLEASGGGGGGTLVIDSDLPIGKGLASSSADLVATARVLAGVLGLEASAAAIQDWLRPIEPTDGVMYPGVVAFDHRDVRLRAFLGQLPPMAVVAIDEGGSIDTIAFNKTAKAFTDAERDEYARLLDQLTAAVREGDAPTIGAVATRSAELNQRFAPKRHLEAMIGISADAGALGVACAHSGTVLGVMLACDDPQFASRLERVKAACAALGEPAEVYRSLKFDANLGESGE